MRGVAFLSGLFKLLSRPTDGRTTTHVSLNCIIRSLRSGNFGVNGRGMSLLALLSTVPSVGFTS